MHGLTGCLKWCRALLLRSFLLSCAIFLVSGLVAEVACYDLTIC
jgi:hypothetical protein